MSLLYLLQIYNNIYFVRDLIRSAWINFITYGYFVAKWEDLVGGFTLSVYNPLYKDIYTVALFMRTCRFIAYHLSLECASNHVFYVTIFIKLRR